MIKRGEWSRWNDIPRGTNFTVVKQESHIGIMENLYIEILPGESEYEAVENYEQET